MTVNAVMHAMIAAAEREWQLHTPGDLTLTDLQRWPRGFHRSGWVVAGYIGCNPFDVLGKPTPAARDTEWQLPKSRPQAARRLVNMWQQGGIDAFAASSFVTKLGS